MHRNKQTWEHGLNAFLGYKTKDSSVTSGTSLQGNNLDAATGIEGTAGIGETTDIGETTTESRVHHGAPGCMRENINVTMGAYLTKLKITHVNHGTPWCTVVHPGALWFILVH
ncbi:hypothetical protein K435DRAFT_914403 [Dendrothele bispora CBS 962.96]|uniref:Uncharacterized protein n=1 Tax=Dendrothele bispora (strain CBS 962.96) TaxID=1314807 RepID=A0A4V4HDD5_DENBC|nr:hypothetical protein K435DRAFT_804799 [Dendrothele bispora CBS 962.96]THU89479.1 hypothetical protein K435DRAFT_914403 [Dendrothele bispora CBS 962.96]